jgi:hypothetical protein
MSSNFIRDFIFNHQFSDFLLPLARGFVYFKKKKDALTLALLLLINFFLFFPYYPYLPLDGQVRVIVQ